jgi:hypothetical protein
LRKSQSFLPRIAVEAKRHHGSPVWTQPEQSLKSANAGRGTALVSIQVTGRKIFVDQEGSIQQIECVYNEF